MDPESNDKSNNCDTEESTMDSSPMSSNNVKEGIKKVLNSQSEDDCNMEVDKDEQLSNNKNSETENGISQKNNENEDLKNNDSEIIKNDCNIINQTLTSNNEQNEGKKDVSSENLTNKESNSAMDCEPTGNEKNGEIMQIDKKKDAVSESSELKNDDHSNTEPGDIKKSVDTDVILGNSSKDDASIEKASKDDVRPSDECSKVLSDSPETIKDNKNMSKEHLNGKESKDNLKSEVSSGSSKESSKKSEDKSSEKSSTEAKSSKGETKKKKSKLCEECGKKGLKFQVLFKGKTRFLCSDTCFQNFKSKQMQPKPPSNAESTSTSTSKSASATKPETSAEKCGQCQKELSEEQKYYPVVGEAKSLCSEECIKKYHADNLPVKNCSQCKKPVENPHNPEILTWETMVFCNEDCLGKYQSYLGSHCTCCQSPVPQASLGKYSVCFGADIRQFCSCSCLDDFKKNLKVCSFCQTDLSSGVDSFLAPVGDKGQFKDFCSQNCMERYEVMNNISKNTPQTQVCSHCKKQGSFKIQVKHDNQTLALCSDLCVAGFRCSHKIKDKMCYTCFNFFNMSPEKDRDFSFKFDGQFKQFCTKACMTLFVLSHRKIVACISCKVKKYNFDMIEKQDANNQTQIFCSLNCLSLYRVSVNAASSKSVRCDNCTKTLPAQYHLTMSDGSVRNFCTYNCVMIFQNQYTNVCTLTTTSATRQTSSSVSTSTSKTSASTSTPVISNVCSLARPPGPTLIRNIVPPKLVSARPPLQPLAAIGSKPAAASTISSPSSLSTVTNASGQQVLREVIVKPPAPKSQKNKSVACKPIMQNKGINVKPQPCHKAVQTDDSPRPILLPVPVPYYVPVPVHMFSRPVPCPVPFPIPMFVPIVLPSKDSSNQEKVSSSPPEENSSKKVSNENSINDAPKADNDSQIENVEKSNCDDIQSTNPSKGDELNNDATSAECKETNDCGEKSGDDEYVFKDGKNHHHGKRHANNKNKGHKKSRIDESVVDEIKSHSIVSSDENHNSTVQNDQLEPAPHLKYMFGVNAWKYWVLQKNSQIEDATNSSRKFKLFKTDLLQLPPDELNYSLSLFVREVRKPDGDEYTSGSLYYLCLGIQRYLFENGRIDNIFSDTYYGKFRECLNDILDAQERMYKLEGITTSKLEEEVLWETKQLGAHSPHVLLNTVMYFNVKHFKLKEAENHLKLTFNNMLTVFDQKTIDKPDKIGVLRYYPEGRKCEDSDCNHNTSDCPDGPQKNQSENTYQEIDNASDSMRCPVRLFEFFLTKCPDGFRDGSDMLYLNPERSCVPDSAVWYSSCPLSKECVNIMIQRMKLIKEVYED